jgi:hypothetical protein
MKLFTSSQSYTLLSEFGRSLKPTFGTPVPHNSRKKVKLVHLFQFLWRRVMRTASVKNCSLLDSGDTAVILQNMVRE